MSAEVASIGVEEAWALFQRRKREKWRAGVEEHRTDPSQGFRGDAMQEASDEPVDFSNYVDYEATTGRVTEEERAHVEQIMFDAFKWALSVMQR